MRRSFIINKDTTRKLSRASPRVASPSEARGRGVGTCRGRHPSASADAGEDRSLLGSMLGSLLGSLLRSLFGLCSLLCFLLRSLLSSLLRSLLSLAVAVRSIEPAPCDQRCGRTAKKEFASPAKLRGELKLSLRATLGCLSSELWSERSSFESSALAVHNGKGIDASAFILSWSVPGMDSHILDPLFVTRQRLRSSMGQINMRSVGN